MSTNPNGAPKVTLWHMLRDIFVTAINKGQLPTAILGLLLVILVVRMPPESLTAFAYSVLNSLTGGYTLGYLLFGTSLVGWFVHAKSLRRAASKETNRIGKEKTALQIKAGLNDKAKSSKKK